MPVSLGANSKSSNNEAKQKTAYKHTLPLLVHCWWWGWGLPWFSWKGWFYINSLYFVINYKTLFIKHCPLGGGQVMGSDGLQTCNLQTNLLPSPITRQLGQQGSSSCCCCCWSFRAGEFAFAIINIYSECRDIQHILVNGDDCSLVVRGKTRGKTRPVDYILGWPARLAPYYSAWPSPTASNPCPGMVYTDLGRGCKQSNGVEWSVIKLCKM